jgi:hypothetical protein
MIEDVETVTGSETKSTRTGRRYHDKSDTEASTGQQTPLDQDFKKSRSRFSVRTTILV